MRPRGSVRLFRRGAPIALTAMLAAVGVLLAGCSASSRAATAAAATPSSSTFTAEGITPLTSGSTLRGGTFSDPFPVTIRGGGKTAPTLFGTFSEALTCRTQPASGCYRASRVSIGYSSSLDAQLAAHHLKIASSKAHHPYQLSDGTWEMAFTVQVTSTANTTGSAAGRSSWNLILHAHPTGTARVGGIPTHWVGDSVIVGSLDHATPADYDGKYDSADGRLYLLYDKELSATPERFGIVAQQMSSPARPAAVSPVTLLAPGSGTAALNSEWYDGVNQTSGLKLVETANITRIDGTYVMVYSTGDYDRRDYKVGLAYSDTFLPRSGSSYRKVLIPDPAGVWGQPGHDEVRYLLQSQEARWPDYAAASVQAPGVGSIIHTDQGWGLIFAGYAPSQRTSGPKGKFNPAHRRPYYVPLRVAIPSDTSLTHVSDATLATWITLGSGS